jgi:hypothetical protein
MCRRSSGPSVKCSTRAPGALEHSAAVSHSTVSAAGDGGTRSRVVGRGRTIFSYTMAADVLATAEPISVTAATEGIGTLFALGSGQRGYLARFEVNLSLSKCFWTFPAPLRGMGAKMNSRGIL